MCSGALSGSAPLLVFVRLCFGALNGRGSQARAYLGAFVDSLVELQVACCAARPDKPVWLIKAEIVLHISERLLGKSGQEERWGRSLAKQVRVHRVRQRECGTYSTPNYVADALFDCVIGELRGSGLKPSSRPKKIVDLSMEAGHFPLVALARGGQLPIDIIGFDRDPEAIGLATTLINRAARGARPQSIKFKARLGDSVKAPVPRMLARKVDAVVGNPPWKTIHPTDESELRHQYAPMLYGRYDVYLAFILRADALLRPGGIMGFVLPSAFLYNDNAARVRAFLLEHYDTVSLYVYPRRTFVELPSVAPIVIVLRKKQPDRPRRRLTTIAIHRSLQELSAPESIRRIDVASSWSAHHLKAFSHINLQTRVWAGISERTTLAELGAFSSGAHLSSRRRVRTPIEFSGVSAKSLTQFHICDRRIARFRAGEGAFERAPPLKYLPSPKVFFQTVRCVSLATRLVAAAGGAGQLACSTAAMFVPARGQDVNFVAGLLNSTLANAWYKSNDHNHAIKISVLERLEIPLDEPLWGKVAALVKQIEGYRACRRTKAGRCEALGQLQRPPLCENDRARYAWELYRQLDDLVFDLYKIPRAERARLSALSGLRSL
jgi:hypothetical protein